ncbi:protein-L-isoaspartate(D-aspartate) O-methyltransferase [Chloroflexota bacterium]
MKKSYQIDLERMVEIDIKSRGIEGDKILEAMRSVPRHLFVAEEYQDIAYRDGPLPIGYGQTISQPYIVALMISLLRVDQLDNVLEIGTGCGYQTAVLANLVKYVFTVEIIPELVKKAQDTLAQLKINNVKFISGDGGFGWEEDAPYEGIVVSAASPRVPKELLNQLKEKGRLVAPVGPPGYQLLETWIKKGKVFKKETGIPVSFVPLLGKNGFEREL